MSFYHFGRLHGICFQIIVYLIITSSTHVHSFDIEIADFLSVILDGSVLFDIDAGQFFKYIAYVSVLRRGKACEVIFQRILSAPYTPGADLNLFQQNGFGFERYLHPVSWVDGQEYFFVAHIEHTQLDTLGRRNRKAESSVGIRQGIIDDRCIGSMLNDDSSRFERLAGFLIGHPPLNRVLCVCVDVAHQCQHRENDCCFHGGAHVLEFYLSGSSIGL